MDCRRSNGSCGFHQDLGAGGLGLLDLRGHQIVLPIARGRFELFGAEITTRKQVSCASCAARYFSYCCLMYTLASKLAVLHARWVQDAAVLSTIDDMEDLCTDLEAKSARKLLLLERVPTEEARASTH